MNRDSLEKLLIDRQFGELSHEAGELLDAWLAAEPKDRELAADMASFIDRVRRADQPAAISSLPGFPKERIEGSLQPLRQRLNRSPLKLLAVAAAMALAFFIGAGTNRSPDSARSLQSDSLASRSSEPPPGNDFWSVSRYSSGRTDRLTTNKQNIKWATPLAWPKTGDAS